MSLEISLGLVDKALYAERYLQNFTGRPTHPYYGRVWLDHDGGEGAGHRPSVLTAALWFKGLLKTSVFAPANRPQPWYHGPPWDVRMDNAEAEIGSRNKDAHGASPCGHGHRRIERVDPATHVVTLASRRSGSGSLLPGWRGRRVLGGRARGGPRAHIGHHAEALDDRRVSAGQ